MNDKLMELGGITAAYDRRVILKDLSLTLYERDFLAVVGPNGGGKTTLLRVILGLLKPVSGHITFYRRGMEVDSINMGYLPQISQLDRKFPISVREVIASGLIPEKPFFRGFRPEQNRRIDDTARQVGVDRLSSSPVGELSGGQLQRVLLGRAIVSGPEVLVLDEPGSYLDKQFESRLYPLLKEINRESAIIMVSHDMAAFKHLTGNIIHIPSSE
jgi:zinc transport system ATP-binding protein